MATSTFSVKIDAEKRRILEDMAKSNYRSLGGEINMAIDLYLSHLAKGGTFIQVPVSMLVGSEVKQHEEFAEPKEMTINDFGDDEVDEL